jgi:uncharacterized cysteine cluster protein YcgN (CxxCxxCC family)
MGNTINTITNDTPNGVYKLNEPMIGYKSIQCDKWENGETKESKSYTAKVEVSKDSIVVKAKYVSKFPYLLRTNEYTIKHIYTNGDNVVRCRSIWDSNIRYHLNHTYKADVDKDIKNSMGSGLHFFLTKKEADEYFNS